MAIYKVIQDIEADDTLIGPLSLKQCIYAAIAALAAYASYWAVAEGVSFMVIFMIPFMLFGAFFAFPWNKQQPTEVWALAKIRFMLKPRRRIWDQSGARELVTITAPKRIERFLTNGLSPIEVKSRLKALADTIDTRGWAVKNVGVDVYNQFGMVVPNNDSDRLISPGSLPQEVPSFDTSTVVDILDSHDNPLADHLDEMMTASASAHREQIVSNLAESQVPTVTTKTPPSGPGPATYWYLNHPLPVDPLPAQVGDGVSTTPPMAMAATPTADDVALMENIKQHGDQVTASYAHLRTIQPLPGQANDSVASDPATTSQPAPVPPQQIPLPPVTPPVNSATLELANNNDLNVATIAREAQRLNPDHPDEVVVSLR